MREAAGAKEIRIESGKYVIRPLKAEDASDRLAAWFSDPDVHYTLNARAKIWSKSDVANYINEFNQTSKLLLGIFGESSNLPAGIFTILINIARQDAGHRHVQASVSEKYSRNGTKIRSDMFVTIFRLANKQIYGELTPRIIDVDSEYPDMRAALFFENAEKQTGSLVKRLYVIDDFPASGGHIEHVHRLWIRHPACPAT